MNKSGTHRRSSRSGGRRNLGSSRSSNALYRAANAGNKERLICRRLLRQRDELEQSLARELHEGVAQQLVAAQMHFETTSQLHDRDPREAIRSFRAGMQLLRRSIGDARWMAGQLRCPVLERFGIAAAADHLVRELADGKAADIRLIVRGRPARMAVPLEAIAYRIVQELLFATAPPCNGAGALLTLTQDSGRLCIELESGGNNRHSAGWLSRRPALGELLECARVFGGKAILSDRRVRVELPVQ
jgi:signal transduction histidine kinase